MPSGDLRVVENPEEFGEICSAHFLKDDGI